MSLIEYTISRELDQSDTPFYALIMAAMRRADSANLRALQLSFPATWEELQARYDSAGGYLPGERPAADG